MSFYTVIQTEITDQKHLIMALEELKKRGEIRDYTTNVKLDEIEVDRSGDKIKIKSGETGFELGGDKQVVERFGKRLKQMYAYASIMDNLPLDFEIGGEINLILKG